jgi:hypothetical protein
LNSAVGTASHCNPVGVYVRELFKIGEDCQLIVKMDLVQRNDSPCPPVIERIDERVIRRATVTSPVRDEENVSSAGKQLPQLGLPTRLPLAPMIIQDSGEWTALLRSVEKPMEH